MCVGHRLPRRRALGVIAATVAAALTRSAAESRASGAYAGPLVDAHSHFEDGVAPRIADLMALYDHANVKGVLLFGSPWWLASDARAIFPRRVVPFLAEGYATALHPDSSYVDPDGLSALLAGGVVAGLGEIILRHAPFQLGPEGGYASAPANNTPADDPRLVRAYRLAGEHGVAVNVHQEAAFTAELARALRAAPETTFVWAHAGHGSADALRAMLRAHPNLMADLSARTPWLGAGTLLTGADGVLRPAWRAVLEEFPDRVLIGLDLFAEAHFQGGYVRQSVDYYRGLLGQFDEPVARLIAHQNAERIAPFAA